MCFSIASFCGCIFGSSSSYGPIKKTIFAEMGDFEPILIVVLDHSYIVASGCWHIDGEGLALQTLEEQ